MHRVKRVLTALLPIVLLCVAGFVLRRELSHYHRGDVVAGLEAIPGWRIGLALAVTVLNYLALTLYDVLALGHVGRKLPYPRVGFTSFVGYAFGHNIGVSLLSGGSVRFRLYSAWGLSALDVAQVAAFNALTFWVGLSAVLGTSLLLEGGGGVVALSPGLARGLGVALWALLVGYVVTCARVRAPLRIRGLELSLPTPTRALAQLAVSCGDWVLAAAVLWVLLPGDAGMSLPALTALFALAQLAGIASQVPAGLGVFESVMLTALSPRVPTPLLVGTLLIYRVVYYLLPFMLAALMLAGNELARRGHHLKRLAKLVHTSFAPVVPWVASAGAFIAGAVLLFSGATPTESDRLSVLRHLVPLPLLEVSHLLGSVVGIGLLLLARGLQRRLDGAYVMTEVLLVAGAVFSVVKGVDYEEATLLLLLAGALAPFHRQFYRHTSLLSEAFSPGWLLATVAVVGASVWLGFFSYRHVDYRNDLWWRFTFSGDAPRFLRATVGVVSVALVFGVAMLLQPAGGRAHPPTSEELNRVRPLVMGASEAMAYLALLGDKSLLLNDANTAFLMYGVSGRSWVSMGDPVGPEADATELAWRFRELADRHHGWTCFYQVSSTTLPRYLDLGLSLLKLGEEATVPLSDFSLEGPERRGLRHGHRRMEREGYSFEVLPREQVPELMPRLRAISDAWLAEKSTREKGFSLGYFSPGYLEEGPLAVVRRDGNMVGFANMWAPSAKEELSVDLMRYEPGISHGVMDFLFTSLMLWGRTAGYHRFNLGMAPFSGFEDRSLAPMWHRLGSLIFRHGEHFYNFQGLRQYKEKFRPEWAPRYLASPGGLALPRVLTGVASLVSRGLGGVVAR
ncbi:bifunctional lysylphosphatidylglycerol flippase/synthetase MprF [Corallococcus sp. H22C18031201]|uniref:bifunctional lysylphosphatidylglycerol flippase/synthetase MprF n=1 Tax=Citreicoccus inhibens TaxID=2849499 RepID=UPI000E7362FB|nr:bifunctional lysylphosphatidylglycerol flippase/synthetase MprF [Citreicoccus inhibens]MBU8896432.1 bifunctional lysylphosphatidylglycerol flippase/synthetase MprF [Citreicoccus inhibens]RJS24192.1 bifunctional lysylphosphatidylglycerol flippase/synthetase MprF [Corallococcus sp. H22C18031201]